jgi:predicted Zn-dependent peptidase
LIRVTALDNGLRIVTERMPDVRSVTFGIEVGTGSRDEPAESAGASHFLEHLLFKGTATRTGREISELIDAAGGDMNAATGREVTSYHTRVLDDDAALGLDLLCETVLEPALLADDVEVERGVILEELLLRGDEPSDYVHDVFVEALFGDHPLGRDPLGTEETVATLDRDGIHGFWSEHYRPANMVVAAAGHLDHDEIVAAVSARFDGLTGGAAPERSAPAPAGPTGRVAVVEEDTDQAHVVIGVRGLDRRDPGRYALAVLEHVLGGGLSSRLWQEVREERGLAYSVYSYRSSYEGAGTLSVYAGTSPDHLEEVLGLCTGILDDLAANGVTPRELDVARGHLVGDLALSLEDSASRMGRIGRSLLVHGEIDTFEQVVAHIRAVTADDVAAIAARLLSTPRTLAVVGPVDEAAVAGLI